MFRKCFQRKMNIVQVNENENLNDGYYTYRFNKFIGTYT